MQFKIVLQIAAFSEYVQFSGHVKYVPVSTVNVHSAYTAYTDDAS